MGLPGLRNSLSQFPIVIVHMDLSLSPRFSFSGEPAARPSELPGGSLTSTLKQVREVQVFAPGVRC